MGSTDTNDQFRIGSILAGVSEGTISDHAVAMAVDLAGRFNARLELFHSVPVPELLGTRFDTSQIAAMNAERVALARSELLAHLSQAHADVELSGSPLSGLLHVDAGPPAKRLLDRAAETEADLIVLGESGKAKNLDFGGVARALLGRSSCPLWFQSAPPRPIRSILAPVDFSDHSRSALAAAVELADRFEARVEALHCYTVEEFAYVGVPYGPGYASIPAAGTLRKDVREHFEKEMDEFDWRGVEHGVVFAEEFPADGILARQESHDLIVIGTHGRTGLAATLLGGVAYRVLRSAVSPVLAIRQPHRKWLL